MHGALFFADDDDDAAVAAAGGVFEYRVGWYMGGSFETVTCPSFCRSSNLRQFKACGSLNPRSEYPSFSCASEKDYNREENLSVHLNYTSKK